MKVRDKILTLFVEEKELTVKEIIHKLDVSKQMVHLVLNDLLESDHVEKLGKPPKTIYRYLGANYKKPQLNVPQVNEKKEHYLSNQFLVITETGEMLEGIKGFTHWCNKRNQPVLKTLDEYLKTKDKYDGYYSTNGFIDGSTKLKKTYGDEAYLDEVHYLDFYAIERFGKTRLGTLLHFAKQGQNKFLMKTMMNEIRTRILTFVEENQFDAVGYVPPTLRREVQIMRYISDHLNLPLPTIEIHKISGIIPVPQKSLAKLDERINNAKSSFAVTDQRSFKKVLLIDDAVGSGATLNHVAEKIKNKKVAQQVIGLAIVGSFKGFDVITDI
ncbi:MAG: hypothetical protein QNK23_14920 [Crocinitomicaceae bacterium]|nr:hypothetical protein [Crocinitomicaceae bacterium]